MWWRRGIIYRCGGGGGSFIGVVEEGIIYRGGGGGGSFIGVVEEGDHL